MVDQIDTEMDVHQLIIDSLSDPDLFGDVNGQFNDCIPTVR